MFSRLIGKLSHFGKCRAFPLTMALFVTSLASLWGSGPAHAWKPVTHVYLADLALQDALDDGKVTIYAVDYATGQVKRDAGGNPIVQGTYDVTPEILAAIRDHVPQFRAGVFGPDAYPDIATGQQIIHPAGETTHDDPLSKDVNSGGPGSNPWLEHLWKLAYGANGKAANQTPEIRSFVTGYMFHAAGDMYAHTFVNTYTGGPFHLKENAIKHIVLEGYLGKRMPDMTDWNVSIDGVQNFIYDNMVNAKPGSPLADVLLKGKNTRLSVPAIFSKMRNKLDKDISGYYHKLSDYDRRIQARMDLSSKKQQEAADCGLFDFSCSKILLYAESAVYQAQAVAIFAERSGYMLLNAPIDFYKEHWRDDIDNGLKAWPKLSHEIAKAMFFNPSGHADLDKAKELGKDYFTGHMLSMIGLPDAVGGTIEVINAVTNALGIPAIEDALKELKIIDLDQYLIEKAFGMTKEEALEYFENPEHNFDLVLNNPKFDSDGGILVSLKQMNQEQLHLSDPGYQNPDERWDPFTFAPALNTLQMTKLILMKPSEINRLMSDIGSPARLEENNPSVNAILGFIRSLDAGNQWHTNPERMVAAQDCIEYRKIFGKQTGEEPCGLPQVSAVPKFYQMKPGNKVTFHVDPGIAVTWSVVNPMDGDTLDPATGTYTAPPRVAEDTNVTLRATATDGSERNTTAQLLVYASPPRPKTFTWTGGGNDRNWTTPQNWGVQEGGYYPGEPGFEDKDVVTLSAGEINVDAPIRIKDLTMGQGAVLKGGSLTVKELMEWNGGTVDNQTDVVQGANLNISGPDMKTLYGTLNNAGYALSDGTGLIRIADDGVFNNTGTFEAQNDGEISGVACCVNPTSFVNAGTLVKTGGDKELNFALLNLVNKGTLEIKSGSLHLGSGLHAFETGSTYEGPVLLNGTLTMKGDVTASGLSNVEIREGSLLSGVDSHLKGTPTFTWRGGTISGQIELPGSSEVDIQGDTRKTFNAATFTNSGSVTWTGNGDTFITPGSVITNTAKGVMDIQGDGTIIGTVCCVDPVKFINEGSLSKSNGIGTTKFGNFAFTNSGPVTVTAGTLEIGGGPHTWKTGTAFSGAGKTLLRSGDVTLDGDIVISQGHTFELEAGGLLAGGTLKNNAYTGSATLKGGGTLLWTEGSLAGNLTLAQDLTTQTRGGINRKSIEQGQVVNNGAFTMLADTRLNEIMFYGKSVFTNNGSFEIAGDSDISAQSCCADPNQFLNNGTFAKSGIGTSDVSSIFFTNAGTVEAKAGQLNVRSGGKFTQTAGQTSLSGGKLTAPTVDIQGGSLTGAGTLEANVNNAGTLNPGSPMGALTIKGAYVQAPTGMINAELAGLQPGVTHDQLVVTGSVKLAGTLNLTLGTGYQPQLGDAFDILKYGSSAGTFAAINGEEPGNGTVLDVLNDPATQSIRVRTVGGAGGVLGDVDGDGTISVRDAMTALRSVVFGGSISPEVLAAMDVAPKPGTNGRPYGDGKVTVADVIRILRRSVGLEPQWP